MNFVLKNLNALGPTRSWLSLLNSRNLKMTKRQTVEAKSNKERRPRVEPTAITELGEDLTSSDISPGRPIGAGWDSSIEARSVGLSDVKLQTVQRHALATQIGQIQGNSRLQEVVAVLQRQHNGLRVRNRQQEQKREESQPASPSRQVGFDPDSWMDNKIDNWQLTCLTKVRLLFLSNLINNVASHAEQLSTRMARNERAVRSPEADATTIGLAFVGNLTWVIGGLGPQSPLAQAIQIGGALIASSSSINFQNGRAVNIPQFLDEIGGFRKFTEQLERGIDNLLAAQAQKRKKTARDEIARLAQDVNLTVSQMRASLMQAVFSELPTEVHKGETNFISAVETYIIARLQEYLNFISQSARAMLRAAPQTVRRLPAGLLSQQELSDFMEQVGISETAATLVDRIRGVTEAGGSSSDVRFGLLQGYLTADSFKVRTMAILSMAELAMRGVLAPSLVIPEIIELLNDEEHAVRVVAADRLAALNNPLVIPAVYHALRATEDENWKRHLRSALRRLGERATRE